MDGSQCSQPVDESVNEIECIKIRLNQEVKRLLQSRNDGKRYMYNECIVTVAQLLSDLDEIPMTVGNLRVTKVGKILTKYEKDLPSTLATMARNINDKWKEKLRIYRQEFKDRLNQHLPKEASLKAIKEEPLSQEITDHSSNTVISNSNKSVSRLDNRQNQTNSSNQTLNITSPKVNQPNQNGAINFNLIVQQNLARSISSTFIQDVRKNIDMTMKRVSSVENECMGIKTAMEEMKQKLDQFENNVDKFVSSVTNNGNTMTTPLNENESVDPKNLSVHRRHNDELHNTALVVSDSENDNGSSSDTSESMLSCQDTPENDAPEIDIFKEIASNSKTMTHTKLHNDTPSSTRTKTDSVRDRFRANFGFEKPVISNNKKLVAVNCSNIQNDNSLGNIFDNINIVPEVISNTEERNNERKSGDTALLGQRSSTSQKYSEGQPNHISLSNKPQREIQLEIKEEICDNNYETHDPSLRNEKNLKRKIKQNEPINLVAKRPSPKPPGQATIRQNMLENKYENISMSKSKVHNSLVKSPDQPTYRKDKRIQNNCDIPTVAKSTTQNTATIDNEGFKVPSSLLLTQTLVRTDANQFLIVKGEPLTQQETGVDLESVELESFLSYSQQVNDMEDELEENERDYLLENKQKNRTSWNRFCKKEEGVKYAPLIKSNGRMKAAHKSTVGKEGIQILLKKKRSKSFSDEF